MHKSGREVVLMVQVDIDIARVRRVTWQCYGLARGTGRNVLLFAHFVTKFVSNPMDSCLHYLSSQPHSTGEASG